MPMSVGTEMSVRLMLIHPLLFLLGFQRFLLRLLLLPRLEKPRLGVALSDRHGHVTNRHVSDDNLVRQGLAISPILGRQGVVVLLLFDQGQIAAEQVVLGVEAQAPPLPVRVGVCIRISISIRQGFRLRQPVPGRRRASGRAFPGIHFCRGFGPLYSLHWRLFFPLSVRRSCPRS